MRKSWFNLIGPHRLPTRGTPHYLTFPCKSGLQFTGRS
jgi:hypothetical protein